MFSLYEAKYYRTDMNCVLETASLLKFLLFRGCLCDAKFISLTNGIWPATQWNPQTSAICLNPLERIFNPELQTVNTETEFSVLIFL